MQQGRRIAAVLAIAAVSTVAEAGVAPALSVAPVSTPVATTPGVTVAPPTATVPNVPAPTVTPVSPPPVVSSPPSVPPTKALPSGGSGGGGSGGGGSAVGGVVNGVKNSLPGGGGSGSSGGGSGSSGGGAVGGVVNGVKKSLPAVNGSKPSTGSVGTVAGGATGGGYSTPGSGNSALSPVFGGTPGGPGGGGFSGPAGFGGPGGGPGAGGPGSPAAFALGIPRGTVIGNGSGGVSAFAAAVASLAGCFYALTPYEQQVLTVRTGIDGRQALSRNQLAALLGTSPAAIGTTERNALGQLRKASQADGCMPVVAAGLANALTAFIGGPFGPLGYVTPAVPPESRAVPGSSAEQQTRLAATSFADRLRMLDDAGGQASLSVLMIIAVMLSAALAALLLEARRSVH
jgi:hypothetical protein